MNKIKRIVIFTDSLGLPRALPEKTEIEETYLYMLKSKFDVYSFSLGGGKISDILLQTFYYKQYKPDIVILQCGIVDCAPRAFTWNEELFFKSNFLGRKFRSLLSISKISKQIRNIRQKSWTSQKQYMHDCKKIIEFFSGIPVFAIGIIPASSSYEEKVPGITRKIAIYNKILQNIFNNNFISMQDIPWGGIMTDGHHLNRIGHEYIYNQILNKLENNVSMY